MEIFPLTEPQTLVCTVKLHSEPIITSVQTTAASSVVLGQEPQSNVTMYPIAEQSGATGVHLKVSCKEPFVTSVMLTVTSVGGGKGTENEDSNNISAHISTEL